MKIKICASVVGIVALLLLMRGGRFSVREERAKGSAEAVVETLELTEFARCRGGFRRG